MSNEDTAMSFQEWSDAGYRVRKGSRSRIRGINGVPQFTEDQVFKPTKSYWSSYDRKPLSAEPGMMGDGESISYFCSQFDPAHQFMRAIEHHCDGVFEKHHGGGIDYDE